MRWLCQCVILKASKGLECWKKCKYRDKSVFAGYVKIRVEISNESNQLLERFEKFLWKVCLTVFDIRMQRYGKDRRYVRKKAE